MIHDPNPLVGHHSLCATRSTVCNPRVRSDAGVTTRSKGMLWPKWHKHTRWLGPTTSKKRKKPDCHSEAIRGHELHLSELASHGSTKVVP
jgi:hypothetical protein